MKNQIRKAAGERRARRLCPTHIPTPAAAALCLARRALGEQHFGQRVA